MKNLFLPVIIGAWLIATAFALAPADTARTSIHLVGDSTMAKKSLSRRPMTGWGEPFATMLCDETEVVNHAENGRSSRSFMAEGHWDQLLAQLQPGDIVMIQFGHNDQKVNQPSLYTQAWHDYYDNLTRFVVDVRTRSAEPILLTPIVRRTFDVQGELTQTLGDYPAATRAVAKAQSIKLIDLNAKTRGLVSGLGPIESTALYLHLSVDAHENYPHGNRDDTHLNVQGAIQVATLVAAELRKTRQGVICM